MKNLLSSPHVSAQLPIVSTLCITHSVFIYTTS